MKLKELLNKVAKYGDANSPALLTGAGVAGLFITAVMVYKASPKIHEIIDNYKEKSKTAESKEEKREVTKEMVKDLAPVVIPPVGMAAATATAIISSNTISARRIAMMSAAYKMSANALKDLQDRIEETFDPKKVQKLEESKAKHAVKKFKDVPDIVESEMYDGDILCLDGYSGQKFRSNAEKIGRAINIISAKCANEMYVSLNEFYDAIDSPDLMHVPMGDNFGWTVDDLDDGMLPISKTACLSKAERPMLVVTYDVDLCRDYSKLHR